MDYILKIDWAFHFDMIYRLSVLFTLYRIGSAVLDQTEWMKQRDEEDSIGS